MYYIDYLETDTACWFDTGIIPDTYSKVEAAITPLAKSQDWDTYIGSQARDDAGDTFQIRRNSGSNIFCVRMGNYQVSNPSFTTGTSYDIIFGFDGYYVDGELVDDMSSYSSMDSPVYTIYIGAVHNNQGAFRPSRARYGEVKVYSNNTLVGDFCPAVNDSSEIGFWDKVSETFITNLGTGTPVAGPISSSIHATPSKSTIKNTGETINIEVTCENAWTVSQTGEWLTLSSTGDTGSTTITATAPNYSGTTNRETTLTFVDTTTSDTSIITIKQKKYTSGQPVYLGNNEISELYIGDAAVSEAYLGENLVYSSGPFVGLKIIPSSFSFNSNLLSKTFKVKSSESWTMTVPEWITASSLTGDTGTTEITLTTTAQSTETAGTISVVSANYSASSSVEYVIGIPRLIIDNAAGFMTSFSPYAAYTGNSNYLKYEINVVWTGSRNSGAYIFATGESTPFFSCERFSVSDNPYCNLGDSTVSTGPENGADYEHSWIVEVNNGDVYTYIDGTQTETKTISGSWPEGNLSFANYSANNLHCYFYSVKFWGANDTLLASFVPASDGSMYEEVSQTTISATGTGTSTFDLLIL